MPSKFAVHLRWQHMAAFVCASRWSHFSWQPWETIPWSEQKLRFCRSSKKEASYCTTAISSASPFPSQQMLRARPRITDICAACAAEKFTLALNMMCIGGSITWFFAGSTKCILMRRTLKCWWPIAVHDSGRCSLVSWRCVLFAGNHSEPQWLVHAVSSFKMSPSQFAKLVALTILDQGHDGGEDQFLPRPWQEEQVRKGCLKRIQRYLACFISLSFLRSGTDAGQSKVLRQDQQLAELI